MGTDIYEFSKANLKQDIVDETPYESKQFNFINDMNSGVYTNSQQSLVQFDLSSIYNSGQFIDLSQMYLVIPIVYTASYSTGSAPVAPTAGAGNEWLITPKSGSWNLIQSMEIQMNGNTVIQQTPNVNFYTNFKLLSQMSLDDLRSFGRTLGMHPDDAQSYLYNTASSSATTGAVGGNGLCNNMVFPVNNQGVAQAANKDEQNVFGSYSSQGSVYNTALQYRSQRIANNLSANGFSSIFTTTNMNNEFLPYFQIANTNYMTWLDVAVIRLKDVSDFFAQAPLTKNLNCLLRIYVNTGYMAVSLSKATLGAMMLSSSNSTFVNTCPFTINQLPLANIPATTTNLVVSCNIARSTVSTSSMGITLALSGVSHPINACRCYYPLIKLKPERALEYVQGNRSKKIVYTNVLSSNYTAITAGSTYNQLIQSGVRNLRGILIIPFISQSIHGQLSGLTNQITPFATYSSPFDTSPNTTPCSLTQVNIQVGGINQLMNYYNYTYEDFVQQVSMYEKINSSDMGLSCGLISQYMWEHGYRFYYFDLSRGTNADLSSPRNINVTLQNNAQLSIDLWVFVEHFNESVLDVETGMLQSI